MNQNPFKKLNLSILYTILTFICYIFIVIIINSDTGILILFGIIFLEFILFRIQSNNIIEIINRFKELKVKKNLITIIINALVLITYIAHFVLLETSMFQK